MATEDFCGIGSLIPTSVCSTTTGIGCGWTLHRGAGSEKALNSSKMPCAREGTALIANERIRAAARTLHDLAKDASRLRSFGVQVP